MPLSDLAEKHRLCSKPDLQLGNAIHGKVRDLARRLSAGETGLIGTLIAQGRLANRCIIVELELTELARELELAPEEIDPAALQIEEPFALRRRGVEGKIVVGDRAPEPDQTLLRALSRAHAWTSDLRTGKPLSEIAAVASLAESYIRMRAQLAFLSPAIQISILDGRQPMGLTLERIIRKPIPPEDFF